MIGVCVLGRVYVFIVNKRENIQGRLEDSRTERQRNILGRVSILDMARATPERRETSDSRSRGKAGIERTKGYLGGGKLEEVSGASMLAWEL